MSRNNDIGAPSDGANPALFQSVLAMEYGGCCTRNIFPFNSCSCGQLQKNKSQTLFSAVPRLTVTRKITAELETLKSTHRGEKGNDSILKKIEEYFLRQLCRFFPFSLSLLLTKGCTQNILLVLFSASQSSPFFGVVFSGIHTSLPPPFPYLYFQRFDRLAGTDQRGKNEQACYNKDNLQK